MTRLNRKAYRDLVVENLEWLMKQPRTLERDHIAQIVGNSVERNYGVLEEAEERQREEAFIAEASREVSP